MLKMIANANCKPRSRLAPAKRAASLVTASSRAGQVAIQPWTGSGVIGLIDAADRTRSESWSQQTG